jgi:glycosyltransferase involved in cell wall biosynthesis
MAAHTLIPTSPTSPVDNLVKLPMVSVVIPVFNERGTLEQLHTELIQTLPSLCHDYEIIFVDDGSTDGSTGLLQTIVSAHPTTHLVRFRANRGKAEALNVGFAAAKGAIVVTMDADLQDKPSELAKLLAPLNNYDMVSGWKATRQDPIGKTLPSRFFNWVTRKTSGLDLHDFNCGFKAYRSEVVRELDLYGEMHRFIPVLAAARGFTVAEVAVEHSPRIWGRSKYGFSRLFKGAYDLLTVLLLTRFEYRPMHFFGTIGLSLSTIGFLILTYMTYLRLVLDEIIGTRPLFQLGILLLVAGIQLASTGLIGELVVRRTRPLRDRAAGAELRHDHWQP